MKRFLLGIIILIFIAACAPWIRTGGPYSSAYLNMSVDLPDGWMRLNSREYLFITRDGIPLQSILVEKIHVSDTLKHTKKKFSSGMLSQEAAEVILDNMATDPAMLNFEIRENNPAKIGGKSGFKAVYTYKSKDGLRYKSIYYGFMLGDWFYGIQYSAPARYYFDKDLKAFEKVVASFKLTKTA
ncbi:MAG: hypothetical protein ACM34I_01010 [bacterium]